MGCRSTLTTIRLAQVAQARTQAQDQIINDAALAGRKIAQPDLEVALPQDNEVFRPTVVPGANPRPAPIPVRPVIPAIRQGGGVAIAANRDIVARAAVMQEALHERQAVLQANAAQAVNAIHARQREIMEMEMDALNRRAEIRRAAMGGVAGPWPVPYPFAAVPPNVRFREVPGMPILPALPQLPQLPHYPQLPHLPQLNRPVRGRQRAQR